MKYPNASETIHSRGPWAQLVAVLHCPCPDGKRRTARITGQPDTMFSAPARVSVGGRTVTGFVTTTPDYREGVREGFMFVPNKFGKNASALPAEWSDRTHRTFTAHQLRAERAAKREAADTELAYSRMAMGAL